MDETEKWPRRRFLGTAAAVGAASVTAGCTGKTEEHRPARAPHRPAHPVVAENELPGEPHWGLVRRGNARAIEGYADRVSVLPGEPFRLYVSTTGRAFRAEVFRMGWYGGAQARRVWASKVLPGRKQRKPKAKGKTRTVSAADWRPSLEVATEGWPEGSYLIRLSADTGAQRFVPITVRSRQTAGRIVLVNAVTTWQAYNAWGGYSLYRGPGGKGDYGRRSLAVSFDRPYDQDGARLFLVFEQPAIALAESLGLPLAYVTSTDLDRDPKLLAGARAVISLGHDEYWSPAMREHVTAARDAGVNLAFLGANACFRRIRLEPTAHGERRLVVCYKTDWAKDPMRGKDDAAVTADWRAAPMARPENSLTGTLYESNGTSAEYVVTEPGHWLFAGTGVTRASRFPNLVGTEYDRVTGDPNTPHPIEVIAHSPLICHGVRSYSDSAYYTTPSGAGVFSTGTMRWVESMKGDGAHGIPPSTARFTRKVTANMLRVFAQGPAGRRYPAKDRYPERVIYPGDPIYNKHDLW